MVKDDIGLVEEVGQLGGLVRAGEPGAVVNAELTRDGFCLGGVPSQGGCGERTGELFKPETEWMACGGKARGGGVFGHCWIEPPPTDEFTGEPK